MIIPLRKNRVERLELKGKPQNKRAVLMVLIITSLTLVGAIALALLTLVKTESAVAKIEIINTRANFVAQSGVDFAIANLVTFAKRRFVPNIMENYTYFGEDVNTNGILDFQEDTNGNGFLDTISCDINNVSFPSFARFLAVIKDKSPVKFVSGLLPSMFKNLRNSDVFILKVVDTSSKIYLYDKNPRLPRIIKNLVDYLNLGIEEADIEIFFKRIHDSQVLQPDTFNNVLFKKLEPYFTFFGQPDNSVIEPVPYYVRNKNLEINNEVYSWIDYLPHKVERASRTPISLNTAPIEIIYANIANIKGTYIDEFAKKNVVEIPSKITGFSDIWSFLFKMPILKQKPAIGVLKEVSIDNTVALAVSEEIKKRRVSMLKMFKTGELPNRPLFYNWEEFEIFLNALVAKKTLTTAQKDLILANVNPNTNLNKFNPSKFYLVDKTDLIDYTTEFTLGTSGIFEIESLAYILESDGEIDKIAAQFLIKKSVKIFDIIKDTTQEDFEKGNVTVLPISARPPLAEIYPVSVQFKNKVPKWIDGYIMMSRTSNLGKSLFRPDTKDYYLFVDGFYSTYRSSFCFNIPAEIFNKKKWRFTLTFWIKPNFSFDIEPNPRFFAGFLKGDLKKLDINYFLFFFMPTINNFFGQFGVNSPFLFYSYPSSETNHQWWGTTKETLLSRNQWYFIAIVIDSTLTDTKWMTKLYINAKEVQTPVFFEYGDTSPGENKIKFNPTDKFCFGIPPGLEIWNFPAEATFDHIAFYPQALSHKKIKSLFSNGRYIQSDNFVFSSRRFNLSNSIIGTINWDDNSTVELAVGGITTYYSLVSIQLFDKNNKNITEEFFNSVSSPVNKTNINSFYYKVKFNITKEFTDEYVLIDSPALNEVVITVIPQLQKEMILTSFSPYEK